MTHPRASVDRALRLNELGLSARDIALSVGVPSRTISDWVRGRVSRDSKTARTDQCAKCGSSLHEFERLPASYAYLLGLYLGDGCISDHARAVYRLRIALDVRYPELVQEAANTMTVIMPSSRVGRIAHGPGCVEVSSYSKAWPCLFPQHGRGKKHERPIRLTDWQERIAEDMPGLLLRGLIHSDGCRFINTGRAGWRAPRYSFVNRSTDIVAIFCAACDRLDIRWTTTSSRSTTVVYVSRIADVALLDRYVGPKT